MNRDRIQGMRIWESSVDEREQVVRSYATRQRAGRNTGTSTRATAALLVLALVAAPAATAPAVPEIGAVGLMPLSLLWLVVVLAEHTTNTKPALDRAADTPASQPPHQAPAISLEVYPTGTCEPLGRVDGGRCTAQVHIFASEDGPDRQPAAASGAHRSWRRRRCPEHRHPPHRQTRAGAFGDH